MTENARALLDAFDALPTEDRRELLAEIFRRSTPESDELEQDLLLAADELFRSYDVEEEESANS